MSQYFSEAKLAEDKTKKLIVACANAKRDEVERIIEAAGEAVEAMINEKNNQGETAAHVAATGGDHYIIQMLLDNGADTLASDKQGDLPIMRAAKMGNYEAVQVFIAHDEESLFKTGSSGQNAYHCAALIANQELLDHFQELDDENRLIGMKDNEGNTPLHCGAMPPIRDEVLAFLLDHGAQVNEQNNKGETALLFAAKAGQTHSIRFLIERGADPAIAAKNGMTPLHECAFRKNADGVEFLLTQKVQLEAETKEGETPLALACAGGEIQCIKMLLDKGANIERGCLHAAAPCGREGVVEMLLEKGGNINSLDGKGRTPLICAVEANEPEMVKYLCTKRANIGIKYKDPELSPKPITAAQCAKLKYHGECEEVLKQAKKDGCCVC
eukprot:TRINITY_DN2458_c0_g1_i1.p1 TRINITY_DN2458_c0_g1~~TRINITY_DN2458_c0_g1_i1.p1  ORF type:complete len:409 (-),score=161.16 TRINITY_DN2458_c0_g1_i1:172-1326(-)